MKKDKSIIQLDYWTSRSWAAFVFGCLLIMQTATITLHSLFSINTKNEQQILPLDFIFLITIRISWFLISIVILLTLAYLFMHLLDVPLKFSSIFRLYFISRTPALLFTLLDLGYLLITHSSLPKELSIFFDVLNVLLTALILYFVNKSENDLLPGENIFLTSTIALLQLLILIPGFLKFWLSFVPKME